MTERDMINMLIRAIREYRDAHEHEAMGIPNLSRLSVTTAREVLFAVGGEISRILEGKNT